MIQMYAGGKPLIAPADISVRVEINSSAFETDAIPVSVVYQFDLPIQGNEETLGYVNCSEVAGKYREIDWQMKYAGIPLFGGRLVVLNSSDSFRCVATLNSFPTDFPDQDLYSVLPEKTTIPGSIPAFVYQTRRDRQALLAFPTIYAPHCYGDDNAANPDWNIGEALINGESVENPVENRNSVIPLYRVSSVLSSLFCHVNYSLLYTVNDIVADLLIFNNYTLDGFPCNYYAFANLEDAFLSNNGMLRFDKAIRQDPYDCFQENVYVVKSTGNYRVQMFLTAGFKTIIQLNTVDLSVCINNGKEERVLFQSSLERVPEYHIYDFIDDETEVTLTKGERIVFYFRIRACQPDDFQFGIVRGHIEIERIDKRNVYRNEIIHKNHLPDVTVSDFLLVLKQNFGLTYYWDENQKIVEIGFLSEILHAKVLDLSNVCIQEKQPEIEVREPSAYVFKYSGVEAPDNIDSYNYYMAVNRLSDLGRPPLKNMLAEVINSDSYYKSELKDGWLIWERLGCRYRDFNTDPESLRKESVEIKAMPLEMAEYQGKLYPFYNDDCVSQAFAPDASVLDKMVFTLQRTGIEASSTAFDRNGQYHEDWLSLSFEGENGIYNRLLREWYEFLMAANEYTFDFHVGIEEMLRILQLFKPQPGTPDSAIRRIRIGNQVYIPKQFTFELTNDGIKCQGKLMKNDNYKRRNTGI